MSADPTASASFPVSHAAASSEAAASSSTPGPPAPPSKRQMCDNCRRPVRTCLCSTFPDPRLRPPVRVVILQHPQEKKQKSQTAWILPHCFEDVHTVVCRKLPAPSGTGNVITLQPTSDTCAAGSTSESLGLNLDECSLLFPEDNTKTTTHHRTGAQTSNEEPRPAGKSADVCAPVVSGRRHTLLVVDATWKYAAEMVKNCSVLRSLPRVALEKTNDLPKPVFVVRKPFELDDGNVGFSTSEAVAHWLDECEKNNEREKNTEAVGPPLLPGDTSTPVRREFDKATPVRRFFEAIQKPLEAYVRLQMECMSAAGRSVTHRPDRPGYDPELWNGVGDEGEDVAKRRRVEGAEGLRGLVDDVEQDQL